MIVKCKQCHKPFNKKPSNIKRSPNHFCSRSCSTTYNNLYNKDKYKKRKTRVDKCKHCGNPTPYRRTRCDDCYMPDKTLGDAIYRRHHASSAYSLVRTRARSIAKSLGWSSCKNCKYDKHIEIAHVKPISDFTEDTLISIINDPSNLLPLCPNCHWEFDNGLLIIE